MKFKAACYEDCEVGKMSFQSLNKMTRIGVELRLHGSCLPSI